VTSATAQRGIMDARAGSLGVHAHRPLSPIAEILTGVEWSPTMLGLLYYTFAVTTYHAPGAKWAMVTCIVALLLQLDRLRWHATLSWIAAFVAWCWLSVAVNESDPQAWDSAVAITKVGLICFAGYNAIQSRAQVRFYLLFCAFAFIAYPVRGALLNYAMGITIWGRVFWSHTYNNPNDLAAFSLLFLAIMLAHFSLSSGRLIRLGMLGAAAATTLVILLTQSRGAFLALLVVCLVAVATTRRKGRAFLMLGAAGILLLPFVPDSAWVRFKGLLNISTESDMRDVDVEGSAAQRFQLMQIGLIIAREHPVVGIGPGRYRTMHKQYSRERQSQFPLAIGAKDSHSTYIQIAAELGFVGLALFLGMIISAMSRAVRELRRIAPGQQMLANAIGFLTLGLLAYLVDGVFYSGGYLNMLYMMLFMLAATMGLSERQTEPSSSRSAEPTNSSSTPASNLHPRSTRAPGMRGGAALTYTR
jgi:putative inorganic carbon (HCO3(-)) transporter